MNKIFKIGCLHPYIEDRLADAKKGKYPKSHYWGCDAILKNSKWNASLISTSQYPIPILLEKLVNRKFFSSSPGLSIELTALRASRKYDLIYSVCGPLKLARIFKKTKIAPWVFRMPERNDKTTFGTYGNQNLSRHSGFFCLTPIAENKFSKFAFSKFIPWCVDLKLFDGKPSIAPPNKPFFLATGKTGRDYLTLVKSAQYVDAEIRIIGPIEQKPTNLPKNIRWINTSANPPDISIDYEMLREWYSQCLAVCIPLLGDPNDTCGYTNLLEGMAMSKPVLMTESGSLHVNPVKRGFGKLIKPGDSMGWSSSMKSVMDNPTFYKNVGQKGRQIAEKEFTIDSFNSRIVEFLTVICTNKK